VAEAVAYRITKLDASGAILTSWGHGPEWNAQIPCGEVGSPQAISLGGEGHVSIIEHSAMCVSTFDALGKLTHSFSVQEWCGDPVPENVVDLCAYDLAVMDNLGVVLSVSPWQIDPFPPAQRLLLVDSDGALVEDWSHRISADKVGLGSQADWWWPWVARDMDGFLHVLVLYYHLLSDSATFLDEVLFLFSPDGEELRKTHVLKFFKGKSDPEFLASPFFGVAGGALRGALIGVTADGYPYVLLLDQDHTPAAVLGEVAYGPDPNEHFDAARRGRGLAGSVDRFYIANPAAQRVFAFDL
jgi:hypothetical protein